MFPLFVTHVALSGLGTFITLVSTFHTVVTPSMLEQDLLIITGLTVSVTGVAGMLISPAENAPELCTLRRRCS